MVRIVKQVAGSTCRSLCNWATLIDPRDILGFHNFWVGLDKWGFKNLVAGTLMDSTATALRNAHVRTIGISRCYQIIIDFNTE